MSARKVTIKRMFYDPMMPHSHTYYLFHKDGRNDHLCNVSVEYSSYHGKRMWWLDPIVGPSDKYPSKVEAIADAIKYLAHSEREPHGAALAKEYLKERGIVYSEPVDA